MLKLLIEYALPFLGCIIMHVRIGRHFAIPVARDAFQKHQLVKDAKVEEHGKHLEVARAVFKKKYRYLSPDDPDTDLEFYSPCRDIYGHTCLNKIEKLRDPQTAAKSSYDTMMIFWPFVFAGQGISRGGRVLFGNSPEPSQLQPIEMQLKALEARNAALELELLGKGS